MTETVLKVPIEASDKERLSRLAESMGQTEEEVATEAIRERLALHDWQTAAIRAGLDQIERGERVSGEAVKSWIASWGTEDELPTPKPGS